MSSTLSDVSMLIARRYFDPVPELLLLAGEEAREARGRDRSSHPSLMSAMAAFQVELVAATGACYWHELCLRSAGRTDVASLRRAVASLDRESVCNGLRDCVKALLEESSDGLSSVPAIDWADYVDAVALTRAMLLLAGQHLDVSDRNLQASAFEKCAQRHLRTVLGPFWVIGAEDDPVYGIAGWITTHAHDAGLIIPGMLIDKSAPLTELRWHAIQEYVQDSVLPFDQFGRLSSPILLETA